MLSLVPLYMDRHDSLDVTPEVLAQAHELDLETPVREAIQLVEPIAPLCRPDCRGLCLVCGVDLNNVTEHEHADDAVDPRLAALAEWHDQTEAN